MGYFRFRRSIKIAPGVRWNIGKKGSSLSFGGRGFTHTIGPQGSRTTISVPGTGVSYTHVHSPPQPPPAGSAPVTAPANANANRTRERPLLSTCFYTIGIILLGIWLLTKVSQQNSPSPATSYMPPSATPSLTPSSVTATTPSPRYSTIGRSPMIAFSPLPTYSAPAGRSEPAIQRALPVDARPSAAQPVAATATPVLSPAAPLITYRIVNIKKGYGLVLYSGPGSTYPAIAKMPLGMRGITLTNRKMANGSTIWQEISVGGYVGWVKEIYLAREGATR